MSRVLVTGGAGFIGSHVVDKLIAAGHEPRILDVRPSPYHPDVDTVIGDMCVLEDVVRAAQGCDAIAHLAAAADVGEVQKDPILSEHLNARGTVNVLEAAREHGVERVVYASTIWVYSDVEAEHVDEDTALRHPAHLYTATKLAGELYCRSYQELYGVESTVLRFGIPYGPRARPAAVIPIFVNKALAGEPLTLAGGGLQSRRFVYVEDLAEGVVAGLAPVAANRTYNLVSDEDVTIRDIAEHVRDEIGNVELVVTEGRAGDFKGAEVSGARAAAELGWTPRTPFAEGLRRYVAWHRGEVEAPARPAAAQSPSGVEEVAPVPLRTRVRPAALTLTGLLAGALAAALTRSVVASDPRAIVATLMLLAVPMLFIASIDWSRERRDALTVIAATLVGTMLAGAVAELVWDWTGDFSRFAHAHVILTLLLVSSAVAGMGAGVRRRVAARA